MGFGERERAVLEGIAERLIPADEHGPGAVQAGAVVYIERALDGAYAGHAAAYAAGLAALAADGFAELGPAAQDARLSALETSADAGERAFFELIRAHVLEGVFGDPRWGGNVDHAGWRLLDYPGPRREWTAADQALDHRPEALVDARR
jgi:gluconate 2-dehydrogenase gamma chain